MLERLSWKRLVLELLLCCLPAFILGAFFGYLPWFLLASVTGLLRRMENHNLIERHIKNGNRRSLYVSLTDFGIEMAKKVENTFNKVDSKALNGFSDSEIELLESMLDRIYENLK